MMKTTVGRMALVGSVIVAALVWGAVPARAAYACTGAPGAVTIKEAVVVRDGESYTLAGTSVRGGVTVGAGSGLLVLPGTEIRGSLTATGYGSVALDGAFIRGNLTATDGAPADLFAVAGMEVRGDVLVTGATGSVVILANSVRGSMTVNDTTAFSIFISTNTIRVNLACAGNTTAPFNGGALNTILGVSSGECAGL